MTGANGSSVKIRISRLMSRMTVGRYLYAVGGNPEAARLSGIPVQRILWLAYAASGLILYYCR
jgi:ribose/xylose/arabinose/galactoside ABC-type transport system permease subunit